MAITITHAKVSAKPDGVDTSLIQPSDWNAGHSIGCASGVILGRWDAGPGAAQEITLGATLEMSSGGVLNVEPNSITPAYMARGGNVGEVYTSNGPGADGSFQPIPAAVGLPAGTVIHVAMNTPPSGYLKANGAAVSRTTYAALFAAIGTTFGAGNGTTTFNLPDLRGEFVRSWADDRAVDTGRVFGSAQTEAVGVHNHTATTTGTFSGTTNTTGAHTHNYEPFATGGGATAALTGGVAFSGTNSTSSAGDHSHTTSGSITASTTVNNSAGPETRPRNIALLACIKF